MGASKKIKQAENSITNALFEIHKDIISEARRTAKISYWDISDQIQQTLEERIKGIIDKQTDLALTHLVANRLDSLVREVVKLEMQSQISATTMEVKKILEEKQ